MYQVQSSTALLRGHHRLLSPGLGLSSSSLSDTLSGCDVAVVVTAHPGLDLDAVLEAPLVVDFRGVTAKRRAANLVPL